MQRMVAWFTENKRSLQTILAAVSMVLILVYTFWHTAALLASFVTPAPVGWIAALGIEAAVVALSLRAGAYKKTLAAALIVSAIANIERGARESGLAADGLTFASIGNIDWIQAVIGVAATALLSVLVFRLADIVSHDATDAPAASEPTAHDAPLDDADWRIVAEGPAEPVHEAVSVPHVVAPDANHANGNGHHAQEDAKGGVCKKCGQAYTGNAGSHWTWDCPQNPNPRKRKGA